MYYVSRAYVCYRTIGDLALPRPERLGRRPVRWDRKCAGSAAEKLQMTTSNHPNWHQRNSRCATSMKQGMPPRAPSQHTNAQWTKRRHTRILPAHHTSIKYIRLDQNGWARTAHDDRVQPAANLRSEKDAAMSHRRDAPTPI